MDYDYPAAINAIVLNCQTRWLIADLAKQTTLCGATHIYLISTIVLYLLLSTINIPISPMSIYKYGRVPMSQSP